MNLRWASVCVFAGASCAAPPNPVQRFQHVREWACAYGSETTPEQLSGLDLVIVDPDGPPPLAGYRGLVVAYLSVGEVHESRKYFPRVKLLGANEKWPGDHLVDLRDGSWRNLLIDEILPTLARYDGLFLDTIDSAFLTNQVEEMTRLIRDIRMATPGKILIANNPESLIDRIDVDGVMAEGVFTRYDFDARTYGKADPGAAETRAARYRGRRVLNLEYGTDPALVDFALARGRAFGFLPYVTTIDLRVPTRYHRRGP